MTTITHVTPVGAHAILHVRLLKTPAGKSYGEFHRTTIAPGDDHAKVLAAINAHLVQMGHDPVLGADWTAQVVVAVAQHHTPALVAAFKAARNSN